MAAERAVAWLLRSALRWSGRRAGVVLVYHALAPEPGDPASELVPAHGSSQFEAQLQHLVSRYRVVALEGFLEAVASRRRGAPFPVAITFDDDLVSHVRIAAPALERAGVPATFFLCGSSLEAPQAFWWQRLELALATGASIPLAGDGIHELAERLESMTPDERAELERLLPEYGDGETPEPGLRGAQVRELVERGFAIGFHTLRHDRMTGLDDDALARAHDEGRRELEEAAGSTLTAIAYPHGKADDRVARAGRDAGFRLGLTGSNEPVVTTSDPMLLGRFEPTHASINHFAAQLVRALLARPHT